jgi:hypothetical protein
MKRCLILLAGTVLAGSAAAAGNGADAQMYLNFSFGGNADALRTAHYGLLVSNSTAVEDQTFRPRLFSMDFTHAGFGHATIAGLPVTRAMLRLNQTEEAAAAPAAEAAADAPWYDYSAWGWKGWTLAGVGVAAVGWYVYDQGQDDDEAPPPASGGGGDECPEGTIPNPIPGGPACIGA